MKKKILLLVIFVIVLLVPNKFSVDVNARKDQFEVYIETGPVESKKKVYLTDDLQFFLERSNLKIEDEPEIKGWGIFSKTIHHYYYMASPYIDEIVYTRKIDTSMDSLVYMVERVEYYAAEYKLGHNTSRTVNDLALGYLRCINKEYLDASSLFDGLQRMGYKVLCNTYEQEFVDYVRIAEEKKKKIFSVNITISEYFGKYVNENSFNTEYGNRISDNIKMIDPIEKKRIDVSHFFAVIDTTRHINREAPLMIGYNLASWLGDLHQATAARNVSDKKDLPVDFKTDVLDRGDSCFDMSDFMADVDGYNIGFNILDNAKNAELKVSESINSYYEILKQDYRNRYKIFIKSVAFYTVNYDPDDAASVIAKDFVDSTPHLGTNGFIYNVCKYMGVNYMNYKDYGETLYYNAVNPIFKFMCENNGINQGYPGGTLRENMTKAFINYFIEMAGYNDEYEDEE